jgi:hypothetical protein
VDDEAAKPEHRQLPRVPQLKNSLCVLRFDLVAVGVQFAFDRLLVTGSWRIVGNQLQQIRNGELANKNSLPPPSHALEHTIAPDQAVEKRCPEMRKEGREEQVGEISVEVAEPRI